MTRQEELAFERKAEKHFKGQRELLPGRNFLWNSFHSRTKEDLASYRSNFDQIRWETPAPGTGV